VALDGVLPFAEFIRTPQGQLLGDVPLVVSANGTPKVESLDAQGLVVSAQPV